MTRERKLAIQMWEEVKRQLPGWNYEIAVMLKTLKDNFCFHNGLSWKWDCWFCQYVHNCEKCPLQSCDHRNPLTAWGRIVDEESSLESRIAACDEIIAALKGE